MTRFRPDRRNLLTGTAAAVAGITLLPRHALSAEEKKLNFYNWDTYIGENTLADFNKASGIEARMDLYADNDELFAKFKAGNPGYDVIVPSSDYVEKMVKAGMLMALNHDKIPNISNIEPTFINDAVFDPGRKFSLPYMWGTIGIGYRKSKVKQVPTSWKFILDSDQYAGRIALLGAGQYVLGMALKYLGYSYNSVDPKQLKQAEDLLIANKKRIKVFADDNGQDLLASGEVDLAQEWSGDILQVMAEDDDLDYVVPDEGSNLWQDCLAIPKGAPHPQNAHAFLNFLFDAKIGADIANEIRYGTPNKASKALLNDDYLKNPAIFPPQSVLNRCEPALYLGDAGIRLRDETWTRIQAA